jgi:hypothetical protein
MCNNMRSHQPKPSIFKDFSGCIIIGVAILEYELGALLTADGDANYCDVADTL